MVERRGRRRAVIAATLAGVVLAGTLIATDQGHAACGDSHACWQRVRAERAWDRCVERNGARYCTFRNRFNRQPASWRRYYVAVIGCEGGDRPGDHSRFIYRAEWVPSTAWKAGLRHGYPTWHEEGLAVIRWTKKVGYHVAGGWPKCP